MFVMLARKRANAVTAQEFGFVEHPRQDAEQSLPIDKGDHAAIVEGALVHVCDVL